MHNPLTTEADRIQTILDAKYKKADLRKEIEKYMELNKEEKEKLENLLKKYEVWWNIRVMKHWTSGTGTKRGKEQNQYKWDHTLFPNLRRENWGKK